MQSVIMKIREHREARHIGQRELARMLGVSHVSVWQWEAGVAYPTADRIPIIADVLNCTIDELYGRDKKNVS